MPSRQINDFSQKRKQKKIELVARPGRDLESVGADLEGVDGVLEVGLARLLLLLQRVPLNRRGVVGP